MKVMYIGHSAQLSGAELGLARLLPRLVDVEPHVFLAEDGPLVAVLRRRGVRVTVLPLGDRAREIRRTDSPDAWARAALEMIRYVAFVVREIHREDPDVVHAVSLKGVVYGGLAARMARKTLVWSLRDRIAADYLSRAGLVLIRMIARLPHVVIANSRATAETVEAWAHDVRVIPPIAFDDLPSTATGRCEGPLRIAMVGRIAPWKGQDVFLRAFAAAFPDGSATGIIAGEPLFGEFAYREELQNLVRDLGIAGQVKFAGFVEDVFALLAEVDVLVHASTIPEPFGQVVVQGFAAGVAVVAGADGGPAEIATHEVDALLVPPGNVDALRDALLRLRDDVGLRRRLAKNGRARALAFDPQEIARETQALYSEATRLSRLRRRRERSSTESSTG